MKRASSRPRAQKVVKELQQASAYTEDLEALFERAMREVTARLRVDLREDYLRIRRERGRDA